MDFGIRQFLALGGLLRIDRRRRVGHIDLVGELLQVIQPDGQLLAARFERLPAARKDEEARALHADRVLAGHRQIDAEVARRVGRSGDDPGLRTQFHARSAHCRAVLVDHAAGERHLRIQSGARQHEAGHNERTVTSWQHTDGNLPLVQDTPPVRQLSLRPIDAANAWAATQKGVPKDALS